MAKSDPGRKINRRDFVTIAAATAAGSVVEATTQNATAQNVPTTKPASRPAQPLGNGEPPAVQFQAYPGGTGALIEKTLKLRGASAFDRTPIGVEPYIGEVPSNEEDIAFLPVHRLSALIAAKRLSCVDVTKIYLDRLKKLDPILLCAVTIMDGPAMEAAQQADADLKSGKHHGPLHGIPYGLKDLFSTRAAPTTWGGKEFVDRQIDEDAEIAVRLRNAGAILIAKLATGRFAINDQWYRGRTNNPWNLKQGSSGSSAGPGSATAAACVAFGIGTETRGSIVSPSIRCGITALRPTFGRVSRHGGMTLAWTMDRVGPMCRCAEDCALVFNAIHGADEKDPSTLTMPFQWDRKIDLSSVRIGYDARSPESVIEKLHELGAEPAHIGPRPSARGIDTLDTESTAAFDSFLSDGTIKDEDSPNGTPGHGRFTGGHKVGSLDLLQSYRRRHLVQLKMAELMKNFDMYVGGNGGDVELCSYTGNPAVVFPYRMLEGEHPQPQCAVIVGNVFADDAILSVVHAFQSATDWHTHRPKLS
jgi:Asp-tRNA(Asn)/Glu-tRNA(Gln) amidotransferase A subunit family amidase